MSGSGSKRVCLGAVAGAHGVRGEFKIRSFTEKAEDVARYGPVDTEDGARRLTVTVLRVLEAGLVLARAPEIVNREDAERLKGARLYVGRAALPAPETDEYYIEDLVGLRAFDESGASLGRVSAVDNFGAGDVIELDDIPGVEGPMLFRFTGDNVSAVDIVAGMITVRRAALDAGEQDPGPEGAEGETVSRKAGA